MKFLATSAILIAGIEAAVIGRHQPVERRALNLTVDLGYGIYKGSYNSASDLNIWKGYEHFHSLWLSGRLVDHSADNIQYSIRCASYRLR